MSLSIANVLTDTNSPVIAGLDENVKIAVKDVTFDSAYASPGGEALTPADLGLSAIFVVIVQPKSTALYSFAYDYAAQKLRAYQGDNDAGADGPAVEVGNDTNLAAVVARVVAIGR